MSYQLRAFGSDGPKSLQLRDYLLATLWAKKDAKPGESLPRSVLAERAWKYQGCGSTR